jgi:hypothetical protein
MHQASQVFMSGDIFKLGTADVVINYLLQEFVAKFVENETRINCP